MTSADGSRVGVNEHHAALPASSSCCRAGPSPSTSTSASTSGRRRTSRSCSPTCSASSAVVYRAGDETAQGQRVRRLLPRLDHRHQRGGKNYLVDGQQRVTSLTLLLIYLYRAAKEQGLPVRDHNRAADLLRQLRRAEASISTSRSGCRHRARSSTARTFTADGKEESVQTIFARIEDIEAYDLAERTRRCARRTSSTGS